MKHIQDPNNPGISDTLKIQNYTIKKVLYTELLDAYYYELEHIPTGAKYIHISNKDTENSFGVLFKTVPADSTGVAHILEHTVLCGSRKYPVRDPFFSMIKRSLNPFMNAFTSSDWTMYPFSTQNKKDFYNLMDVYLDAVFFPKLDALNFKQEGHRIEIEDTGDEKLAYKGVVYNEMKGAMSSPSQVFARSLLNIIYPDTIYRYNSGGDPAEIPNLTYEQLVSFHARHYHPSNAFFYSYGNLPLKKHLRFVQEKIFDHFDKTNPNTNVPSQPKWSHPKIETRFYPLDKTDPPEKKCQICIAWLTTDIKNSFEMLTISLLEEILLGNSASPLRQALIDSKLGSALCDYPGFDPDNKDTLFVAGLKDVRAEDAEKIETIILNLLTILVKKGIEEKLVQSAIHQIEFHRREITNTPYPHGIKLFMQISGSWIHDGNPVNVLQMDKDLEKLRQKISGEPFLENRIKLYFLENTHRVLFTLKPDHSLIKKETERVAGELEEKRRSMTQKDIEVLKTDEKKLKLLQEKVEDVSILPTLTLKDISPTIHIVKESKELKGIPAACYEESTSGILYFSTVLGTGRLSEALFPLVPLFCYVFPKMGTTVRDYIEMTRNISACTGGIGLSANVRTCFDKSGTCLIRHSTINFV